MTIYIETLIQGLVPVKFIGWAKSPLHDTTGCYNAVVKVVRTGKGYHAGEVLHLPHWSVVEKAGRRDYKQLVRMASLPLLDVANVLPARLLDYRGAPL